jgi:hypothetical protein
MKWLVVTGLTLSAIPIALVWGMAGPRSLRKQFARDVRERARDVTAATGASIVTEADLIALPEPVRRYLRKAGVVGRLRPRAYRLTMTGRIRSGPDESWMPFHAEQFSSVDGPVRLFYMSARRSGVPVAVLHRYVDGRATMTVKLAGLLPLVDAHGPVMDQSETVTVFNDMCLLAPGTLLDGRITWRSRDDHSVDATFSAAGQTISATLTFDDDGLLTNFTSFDRSRSSADGRTFTVLPFLTPVHDHGTFDGVVLARHADAQWRTPDGQLFTYAEFAIESATFNVPPVR